jgi:hypothetical protein
MAARSKCYQLPLADDEFIVFSNQAKLFCSRLVESGCCFFEQKFYTYKSCTIDRCIPY